MAGLGVDLHERVDEYTPLLAAAERRHLDMVDLLLSLGVGGAHTHACVNGWMNQHDPLTEIPARV